MPADFVTALQERFPQTTDRPSSDHPAFNVPLGEVVAVLKYLRDDQAFDLLMDVTAIDWAEGATLLNRQGAPWPEAFRRAIGAALKDEDDLAFLGSRLDVIVGEAAA